MKPETNKPFDLKLPEVGSFFLHPWVSVFIRGKYRSLLLLCFCASVVIFGCVSCFGLDKDMGLTETPDLELREGPRGTLDDPAPLDPFKRYDLVLAANETRVFSLKVPSKWFWKISLTVSNREVAQRGKLSADILPKDGGWVTIPGTYLEKDFDLSQEGLGVMLGVGNPGGTKNALLQLTQQGAPLRVTITSEISATKALVVPNATPSLPEKNP
jgi:hypothetical protein